MQTRPDRTGCIALLCLNWQALRNFFDEISGQYCDQLGRRTNTRTWDQPRDRAMHERLVGEIGLKPA